MENACEVVRCWARREWTRRSSNLLMVRRLEIGRKEDGSSGSREGFLRIGVIWAILNEERKIPSKKEEENGNFRFYLFIDLLVYVLYCLLISFSSFIDILIPQSLNLIIIPLTLLCKGNFKIWHLIGFVFTKLAYLTFIIQYL